MLLQCGIASVAAAWSTTLLALVALELVCGRYSRCCRYFDSLVVIVLTFPYDDVVVAEFGVSDVVRCCACH